MEDTEKFMVGGQEITLTADEALSLMNDIRDRFGWIGATITPEDIHYMTGNTEPIDPDVWTQLEDNLADDVFRLLQEV